MGCGKLCKIITARCPRAAAEPFGPHVAGHLTDYKQIKPALLSQLGDVADRRPMEVSRGLCREDYAAEGFAGKILQPKVCKEGSAKEEEFEGQKALW